MYSELVASSFTMTKLKQDEEKTEDKPGGDNEDSESLEEQPLDVGEHYLVRRKSDDWREFCVTLFYGNSL